MSDARKPSAFRLPPEREPAPTAPKASREPRSIGADYAVTPAPIDVFEAEEIAALEPPPALPPRRRSKLAALFFGGLGVLVSLAIGLWLDQLIRDLFERTQWLGWLAAAMAALAVATLLVILIRELVALAKLASVEKLRSRGLDALARNDSKAARSLVDDLTLFVAGKPETAAGRRALAELQGEVIDGADLVRLAEAEILAPLDARAQKLILDAAKRVSIVTAVSPRALVDVVYVMFEAGRLIRRMSELYGGRPGTLGFFRLARDVLAHLGVSLWFVLG
jgi:putative membrane protein